MKNGVKRSRLAQVEGKEKIPPLTRAHGWGGRRHGLSAKGENVHRLTITLSKLDWERLELLRTELPKVGVRGDSSIKSTDGRLASAEVVRLALRVLEASERLSLIGAGKGQDKKDATDKSSGRQEPKDTES